MKQVCAAFQQVNHRKFLLQMCFVQLHTLLTQCCHYFREIENKSSHYFYTQFSCKTLWKDLNPSQFHLVLDGSVWVVLAKNVNSENIWTLKLYNYIINMQCYCFQYFSIFLKHFCSLLFKNSSWFVQLKSLVQSEPCALVYQSNVAHSMPTPLKTFSLPWKLPIWCLAPHTMSDTLFFLAARREVRPRPASDHPPRVC